METRYMFSISQLNQRQITLKDLQPARDKPGTKLLPSRLRLKQG